MRKTAARLASETPSFVSELGRLVVDRRRELGLSQLAIVERTQGLVSQSTLSRIEVGEYLTTSDDRLQALASALQMPVSDLVEAQKRMIQPQEEELARGFAVSTNPLKDLSRVASGLNKDDLATLVRLARVMAFGKKAGDRGSHEHDGTR